MQRAIFLPIAVKCAKIHKPLNCSLMRSVLKMTHCFQVPKTHRCSTGGTSQYTKNSGVQKGLAIIWGILSRSGAICNLFSVHKGFPKPQNASQLVARSSVDLFAIKTSDDALCTMYDATSVMQNL